MIDRRPAHAIARRFAERILTSKGFTVTAGDGCDLIVNGTIRINVKSSHVEFNRESFCFKVDRQDCDIVFCLGLGEKSVKQQVVTYVIPAYEVNYLKSNIRIPVSGRGIYGVFLNRFDLIGKMVERRERA